MYILQVVFSGGQEAPRLTQHDELGQYVAVGQPNVSRVVSATCLVMERLRLVVQTEQARSVQEHQPSSWLSS